jgi:hypothetical protein
VIDKIKKRTLLNKTISVVLSTTLLFNVASASSLNDILLTNSTYAGDWEDPTTGMNYYTGGGIKVKFKNNSQSFTPWIKVRGPSVNYGCNGVSIDGGFMALLGLDDIEKQLKDGGAAFAWGILIGLAYSLPVIGDVFQKIQKWARQIQQLLQNACQIGQNLARTSQVGHDIKNSLEFDLIDEGFDKIKGFIDSIDKQMKELDDLINCNGDLECMKKKKSALSKMLSEKLGVDNADSTNNGLGAVAATAKVTDLGQTQPFYKEFSLKDILTTSSTIVDITAEQILNVKLALAFFGDIAMSEESSNFIDSNFNDTTGLLDDEEIVAKAKKGLLGQLKINEAKYEIIAAQKDEVNKIIDILINGTKEVIYIPNYKVGVLQIPVDSTKKTSYMFLLNEIDTDGTNHNNLKLEWGGFFNESLRQVLKKLNTNVDGSETTIFTLPTSDTTIATTPEQTPVLIPSIDEYIFRLRKAMMTKPELKFSVQQSANKIAQVNSALATFALVNEITSRVKQITLKSTDQKETFIAFIESIEKKRDSLINQIKQDYKDDRDILMMLDKTITEIENTSKKGTLK